MHCLQHFVYRKLFDIDIRMPTYINVLKNDKEHIRSNGALTDHVRLASSVADY